MSPTLDLAPRTYRHPDAALSGYCISTDPARLDVAAIEAYLTRSYWATGRPRAIIEVSLAHSYNFGLYHHTAQVGLARLITDYAVFAYFCDVYVLEEHQGQGLGKWLVQTVLDDPALATVSRFTLSTRDAHGLYAQHGFTPLVRPQNMMDYFPKRTG
jgi:GNAT superfamily N-acetyltransferase